MFGRFRDALSFATFLDGAYPRFPIWSCEVRRPVLIFSVARWQEDYKRFWESFPVPTDPAPTGTFAASAVKLLNQVC